ncbi:MAG: hypothetical protein IIT86_00940 [Oscillospiraceae bacterium]|nr:hypothetical protein [Acidaminococcaceae bacterium]MBQ5521372.1 hypothetical protein [Oscillospiraceae bacterium]
MKDEYISVSEFARRAGVSRQAIQQRLDTSLRDFVKLAQGKKLLNIKGLELFDGVNLAQGFVKENVKLAQGSNEQNDTLEQGILDLLRAELVAKRHHLEALEQQLKEKDRQIQALEEQLKVKDRQIDAANIALRGAQELHAGTIKTQLGPGPDRSQEPEQVITVEDRPAAPAEPERKRHWWPWPRKE